MLGPEAAVAAMASLLWGGDAGAAESERLTLKKKIKIKKIKIMYKLGCKIIIRKLKERQNYVFIDYEDIM